MLSSCVDLVCINEFIVWNKEFSILWGQAIKMIFEGDLGLVFRWVFGIDCFEVKQGSSGLICWIVVNGIFDYVHSS